MALFFQELQRTHQKQALTIRQKTYFKQAVKIGRGDFATVKRLRSRVHIDPKTGGKATVPERPDIFTRQEFGGLRKPQVGHTGLAIPQESVKRTGKGLIRKAETPARLKRAFVVQFASGSRGLFRRIGRRQKAFKQGPIGRRRLSEDPNIEFMYFLAPSAAIEPVYEFFQNAQIIWRTQWSAAINRRMDQAFAGIKVPRNRRK